MPFSVRSRHNHIKSTASSSMKCKEDSEEDSSVAEPKFPIRKYDYVEGRNYRQSKKPSEQFLPCDDEELERLQVNNLLFKCIFAQPYFSPLEEELKRGIRVLDVSTGPGWWLIDMAKQYPKSHFTGLDVMIYPISSPPTNCHFRVIDLSKGLPFHDNTFDFVTQHDASFRYCQKDWEIVVPEMRRVLKPGGYLEMIESSGSIQDIGPNMSIWMMRLTVSLQTRNINLKIAGQLEPMLESIGGFENINASHRSAPIGWYGRTGDLMLECIERLFDAVKPKICEDWSMTGPKYDKVIKTASSECRDFRSWTNIHFITAQKKKLSIE